MAQVQGQNKRIIQLESQVQTQATQLKVANEQINILLLQSEECRNHKNNTRKRKRSQSNKKERTKRSSSFTNRMARIEDMKTSLRSVVRESKQAQTQFRSCHEIFAAYGGQTNHALHSLISTNKNRTRERSFHFHIDPDGQGIGAPPIYVWCNLTNGKLFYIKVSRYIYTKTQTITDNLFGIFLFFMKEIPMYLLMFMIRME